MQNKRILIIEDDMDIAEMERDFLAASEFEADILDNGNNWSELFNVQKYDAVILDLMIPGKNGITICREIREQSSIPIIMITARKEDIDKIRGLSVGADDYIVKPFSPFEMVARVKAHISIHERIQVENRGHIEECIELSDLRVYPKARKVEKNGMDIMLTNKEFELLDFFLNNPNIVFSKEILFERIWGLDAMGDLSTVTVHINRLREKIEKDPAEPELIQTVWGVGYKFVFR